MKRIAFIALCTLFAVSVSASEKRDTLRVLFVGNSYVYYNNLIQMVSLLSDSMDTKLICTKSTVGGTNLREHWNGEKGLHSRELIEKNKYDVVVFQDHSMRAIEHPDSLLHFGKLFCALIKKKGARSVIYNTWSRKSTPETQETINQVYHKLSKECGAEVANVGNSWHKAMGLNPNLELYASDGSHPSSIGTYLAALVFIKTITGKLPSGFASVYNYYDRDGETFRIMQVSKEENTLCLRVVNNL